MRRARADAEQGDWSPKPGTHKAIVDEGDAFESKAGDPYAKTTLRLVAPGTDDDGRTWDHLLGFRTPQQAAMSAGQLSVYGIPDEALDNLDDVDDLARHMAELVGLEVEVTCKSRDNGDGVWTNVSASYPRESDVPGDTTGLDPQAKLDGDDFKPPAPPPDRFGDDAPF